MKIPAQIDEVHVSLQGLKISQAFRPPNSNFLNVSVKDHTGKTLYKVFFEESSLAKKFRNTRKDSMVLLEQVFVDDEGREMERIYFHTKKCAQSYLENYIQRSTEKITRPNIVNVGFGEEDFGDDPFDEDLDLMLEEFENDYAQKIKTAEERAKNVLKSSAKYFLDIDQIENNEWLFHKIEMETRSLSLLLFQADVSELAIKKMMASIYTDTAGVKQYEALASLQKIVLDINKNQSSLVERLIKDFKDMKARVKEIEDSKKSDDGGDEDMVDGVILRGSNLNDVLRVAKRIQDDSIEDVDEEE